MNKLKQFLAVLSSLISLFFFVGVLATIPDIGGMIFYLIFAVIFAIPFAIYLIHHLNESKADRKIKRMQKEANKKNLKAEYDNKISREKQRIEMENQAKEYEFKLQREELIKEQERIESQMKNISKSNDETAIYNSDDFHNDNQEQATSTKDLLLMKIDSLSTSGVYFENVICELLKSNGYTNVESTKASNDYGIDILAEKEGITYAIQCKCYSSAVGNKAVQEAYTGKNYYNKMIAVVATNSTFSKNAIEMAKETQVLLWDRNKLIEMINNMSEDKLKLLVDNAI